MYHQRGDLLAAIRNHSSFWPGLHFTRTTTREPLLRKRTMGTMPTPPIDPIAFYVDNFTELAFEEIRG